MVTQQLEGFLSKHIHEPRGMAGQGHTAPSPHQAGQAAGKVAGAARFRAL